MESQISLLLTTLLSGWSLQAKLDGELCGTTAIYSGTGIVRKEW
jgi:hypothetical protein